MGSEKLTKGQRKALWFALQTPHPIGPSPEYQGDFVNVSGQDVREMYARGFLTAEPMKSVQAAPDSAPYLQVDHVWMITPAGRSALSTTPKGEGHE